MDPKSGVHFWVRCKALLDGIPESIVIGVSLLEGAGVSLVAVVAVFLSNLPEGLSSAAGMRRAGHSKAYIFGIWCGIAVNSGVAALIGSRIVRKSGARFSAPNDALVQVSIGFVPKVLPTFGSDALRSPRPAPPPSRS